jgi:pilus assembly protein CpaC
MKMLRNTNVKEKNVCFFCLVLLICVFASPASAQNNAVLDTNQPDRLQLVVGKSITLKSPQSVKRISVAAPDIADIILISPREVYITGKSPGVTNLTLWQNKKIVSIYDLEVSYDVSGLKQKLAAVLPDEKDMSVFAAGDSVTLAGRISSTANLSQAIALAKAYAPEGNVNNLLEVAGIHQVMLEVRVAEISKLLLKQLGVNFTYTNGTDFGMNSINQLIKLVEPDDANLAAGPLGLLVSPAANAFFRFSDGSSSWTTFIDALKTDGMLKVLAEPTLIALSGETANFLAGGEFPVPVPQGLGTVAIEYKPYGVGLSFTPTVLSEKKISIKVSPEVSELDFSTAVDIEGFTVPGLTTRRAATVVDLADGQSFAIAGLLSETVRDSYSRYPALGDIPILGTLFRSRKFQKQETELVIVVTPRLVKPLDLEEQSLPTDFYIEPDDADIFLWGLMQARENENLTVLKGELDGDFGHVVPLD